jgi:hypothetical protein
MSTHRNHQRLSLLIAAAGAIVLAAGLSGCKCPKAVDKAPKLTQAAETTKAAAVEIKTSAEAITQANALVAAKAPDLEPQTTAISAQVATLQATSGKLETTATEITAAATDSSAMAGELDAAHKKIAELEASQNGLLSRILTLGAVAGLGLAVVAGVWLRSASGVLTGLAIFGACVGGQWLLAYRAIIGISTLAIAGVWVVWTLRRERLATTQVVSLVEKFKPVLDHDQFKQVADTIQSKATKRIVNAAQRVLGVKKP